LIQVVIAEKSVYQTSRVFTAGDASLSFIHSAAH
jgi:hypothetical protein